ncbi:MAG TPA: DUF2752 domain-containing protein [Segeticoccus sp.]|uniref:DUF2752 domain-containing protein n=1 Tax=Segeticoccus sp. TaxID=2706531 RepID=UPI002D7F041A|nr:DUF2752 domain-containing protein [Segeticoccus sp.]HET8599365.1 DUF2752 domain-containing protein [Segeticoccus sp.]
MTTPARTRERGPALDGASSPAPAAPATHAPGGWRGARLPALVAGVAASAVGYLAAVDPNQAGHYPTCPFLFLTGWYCPGCGSLRAIHDLAHLDLAGALARNPLVLVAVPYLLITWGLWLHRSVTGRPRRWLAPAWVLWTVLGAVLAYWVLRNVPGWTWLSPA